MFPIHLPIDCLRDHEMAGRRGRGEEGKGGGRNE